MPCRNLPLHLLFLTIALGCWPGCQTGYEAQRLPILGLEHVGEPIDVGDVVRLNILSHEGEEGTLVTRIGVVNLGLAPMDLNSVRIEGDASSVLIASLGDSLGPLQPDGPARWIMLERSADGGDQQPSAGELVVRTSETLGGAMVRRVPLVLQYARGQLMVNPGVIEFGAVPIDAEATRPLKLINTGKAPLAITSLALLGHTGFAVFEGEQSLVDGADDGVVDLTPPISLQPGATRAFVVHYTATSADAVTSELRLTLADDSEVSPVPLSANTGLPCLKVNPDAVTFGHKALGTTGRVDVELRSCGDEPLIIESASLVDDTSEAFALDEVLGGEDVLSLPRTLGVNEAIRLRLRFTPPTLSPTDATGDLVPFTATLRVNSNAMPAERDVPVEGIGSEHECPTPVIVIMEGEEVIPQTRLHLDGTQSFGAAPIVGYEWTVEQPSGAVGFFSPSPSAASPQFSADVAGLYTFHLKVSDANGESCGPDATAQVMVVPDDALHIELLWSTPLDSIQTDTGGEAGTDLDLHLVHPFAAGIDIDGDGSRDGYFDIPYDCFWFNTEPVWGSFTDAGSDPRLDRDDTDGGGPENMNMASPQDGVAYRVGVHYWDAHQFGPSFATLRVYVYGTLVYEAADVRLVQGDLWDALSIAWPSGEITRKVGAEDQPVIYPMIYSEEFPHP